MSAPAVDLTELPNRVGELVAEAARAGEIVLTRDGEAVAKIVSLHSSSRAPRRPGSARGMVHMADDFDVLPDDFQDYV